MTRRATCWILPILLGTVLTPLSSQGRESSQVQGGNSKNEPSREKQKHLSPLRVRPLAKHLSRRQLGLFRDLYSKSGFGAGSRQSERLGFIVEVAPGEWTVLLAPSTGDYARESYRGAVPVGTVGIAHTHPRDKEAFKASRTDKKAVGIYRDQAGAPVRVNWNYILHVDGILAVDALGNEHVVATQGWFSSAPTDAATSVTEWVPTSN